MTGPALYIAVFPKTTSWETWPGPARTKNTLGADDGRCKEPMIAEYQAEYCNDPECEIPHSDLPLERAPGLPPYRCGDLVRHKEVAKPGPNKADPEPDMASCHISTEPIACQPARCFHRIWIRAMKIARMGRKNAMMYAMGCMLRSTR